MTQRAVGTRPFQAYFARLPLQWAQRVGLLGWVSIAAAVACLVIYGAAGRAWMAQAEELGRATREIAADVNRQVAPLPTRRLDADQALYLPPSQLRHERLARLLEVGERHGLSPARTEHRLLLDQATGLEQFKIAMPLRGPYPKLRKFMGEALQQDVGLSLDAIRLNRASPATNEVEAELHWTLHARTEPTP